MSKKIITAAAALALVAGLINPSYAQGCVPCVTEPPPQMRDITTMDLVREMGLGINLGNTFEAVCHWLPDNACGSTVNDYETAWGSPTVTRSMIQGYKTAGIKTVRVPVAWSNMMTGDALASGQTDGTYDISPLLLARVKEVVDMIIEEEMYAIINIHWDGGWWEKFPTDSTEAMRKFRRIWEQVGNEFKDHGDRLLFASLNEEGGWNSLWEPWTSPTPGKNRSYGILNTINQAFVDLIRSQGGNNPHRHLQVQGYQTNIERTVDPLYILPTDPRAEGARIAVSVHYYDPFGFTHLDKDEDWEPLRLTWGTEAEIAHLNTQMDLLVDRYVSQGVPVIIGEYGFASGLPRDTAQVRNYTVAVTKAIYDRQMAPVLWDVQLNAAAGETIYYYNRHSASFADPLFVNEMRVVAGLNPVSVRHVGVPNVKLAVHPSIAVRGKMLTLTTPSAYGNDVSVRLIDVGGRVRANFRAVGGVGSFNLGRMPSGRYFVEVRGAGIRSASPVILK